MSLPALRLVRLPSWSTLHWALGLSVLFHAVILSVQFVDPVAPFNPPMEAPLDIVLVNARAPNTAPDSSGLWVAQAQLRGDGNGSLGRPSSPLPAASQDEAGEPGEPTQQRLQQLRQEQQRLLAEVRRELAQLVTPDTGHSKGLAQARDVEERRKQLLKVLGEIERNLREDQAGPRQKFVGPSTREGVYALYYDALRKKIEARGTSDFPQSQGNKLYGELTVHLVIDAQGRLLQSQVLESSGSKALDQRALAIVRAAAPFGEFSSVLRLQADQLVVTSRLRFGRESGPGPVTGSTP